MKLVAKFLLAEGAWAGGILVLMVAVALLSNDQVSAAHILRWVARDLGLAAFPAGLAVAPAVFARARPWRELGLVLLAAAIVSVVAFLLSGVVAPMVSDEARSLPRLMQQSNAVAESWETRNDASWVFFTTFFSAINAFLFVAIGLQVGIWSNYALPGSLRRALYWAVGLGLLVSGFGIWDSTYETIVLHTAADASFSAFYTLLIPASICAGLALPTLALLRGGVLPRSTS